MSRSQTVAILVATAALGGSACGGGADALSRSHPGRDLKPITAPGFPLGFFLAMHDAGVVRFVINPVAVDTRGRRVAS